MNGVWLIIPAHGRLNVSAVAFAGIRWTLDELDRRGVEAHALVIAEDGNLDIAEDLGFETLWRENQPLGRKWNDGYEMAGYAEAEHVMPCGSDDWIHPDLICAMLAAQSGSQIACTRSSSAVRPDGSEIATLDIPYPGGDGVRLLPTSLIAPLKYRPTIDKRNRAIDGATFDRISRNGRVEIQWAQIKTDPLWIVDFKTRLNLTSYEKLDGAGYITGRVPVEQLRSLYPDDLVTRVEGMYR